MGHELLFEIGVEEIPPKESPILAAQLSEIAKEQFREARLNFSKLDMARLKIYALIFRNVLQGRKRIAFNNLLESLELI